MDRTRQPSPNGAAAKRNDGAPSKGTPGTREPEGRRSGNERLACVEVPALPLQLLARSHPEWTGRPMAVVDEDRPQGTILWVNEAARRHRVLPGLRYAAGLSLCADLCAGEVRESEVDGGVTRLVELLWRFSPAVEPCADESGVFWLDASGLGRLEPSLARWARRIRATLDEEGFVARVAVGFGRFGTYALARTARVVAVVDSRARERELTRRVRLERLQIDPELRDALARLDVHTVGRFLELPAEGLGKRFGAAAVELHRRARGELDTPLEPVPPPVPVRTIVELEYAEGDAGRLLFLIKRALPAMLGELAGMQRGLAGLEIELLLDAGGRKSCRVKAAAPTLEEKVIIDLVRLRLDRIDLSGGVSELVLTARGVAVGREQLALFYDEPERDLAGANRALARLRAEFGDESVVWARPREAHLPEATFSWEPLDEVRFPEVEESGRTTALRVAGAGEENDDPKVVAFPGSEESEMRSERTLIRRLYDSPRKLPARQRHEPDGWLVRGLERGPAVTMRGPYVVSGGWWVREVHREYYFVETQRGDVLWVYYDRHRRRWMLHGQVE